MADLRPQFSEEVVGHGHPTKADVANRAWNVEHEEDGTHKAIFLAAPTGTIMLFGQNAAPTGWTRKDDWQDNAMLCYASAGAIANGGAVNPQNTHTHTGPSHDHDLDDGGVSGTGGSTTDAPAMDVKGSGNNLRRATGAGSYHWIKNVTDAKGTGATGANTAVYYQEIIAATKD